MERSVGCMAEALEEQGSAERREPELVGLRKPLLGGLSSVS